MRVGTVGFIGGNLTKAREARGLSQAALSRMVDVKRQAVSEYENGRKSPSPETMSRISQVLNVPFAYFSREIPELHKGALFMRSMSAVTKMSRVAGERRYEWLRHIASYLKEHIRFPAVNFPELDIPENFYKLDGELIEKLASETRRHWGLGDGPISNVAWLLENNGAIVARFHLDADTLDAFSEFSPDDQTPYIILGADKDVCVRSRFDAAHELAHIILHRRIDKSKISNSSDFKLIEKQAHRFAAAFLLPAESFEKEVFKYGADLDTFEFLKSEWLVSIQLQINRAQDLGMILPDQIERLWKNCSYRGWRRLEPLDDTLPVEEPRLLKRGFQMILENNIRSTQEILAALPYSIGDIADLTGLSVDDFEDTVDNIIALRTGVSESSSVNTSNANSHGQILQFRPKSRD